MKGKITGAIKVSVEFNNKIPNTTQPQQQPAQIQTNAPVVDNQGGLDTAFTTPENSVAPTDELFNVDANVGTDELQLQQTEVSATVAEAKDNHTSISEQITSYEATIQAQGEWIAKLSEEISNLETATGHLQQNNAILSLKSQRLEAQIAQLDTQIEANSGILGTISNGISSFFGKGVDVEALKTQKAGLVAQKEEIDNKINENNKEINKNEMQTAFKTTMKTATEASQAKNQEHADALKEKLGPLEERIINGEATLEEIEAAIKEANEKAGIEASDEDVRKGAIAYADAIKQQNQNASNEDGQNKDATTNTTEEINNQISNYLNSSSESENGECDNEILTDMYQNLGFTEEDALARVEIIEAVATYEEIGLDIGIVDLATMSIADLDAVVEQAIVQDVIKSTSTKIMGNIKGITSKKDKEALTKTQKEFTTSANILDSYYRANGDKVGDKEVESQVELNNNMISNINQGGVYDTSKLEQVNNKTLSLLTSYQTKVNSSIGIAQDTDTQFLQEKTKTEDILKETETTLGDNAQDNNNYSDSMVEFLNLTTNFNNAETDSEKISYTKLMKELGEKAQRVQDDPDSKNPYIDGSLWIAA